MAIWLFTPVVIVMRGLTFHPAALIAWTSGLYFAVFSLSITLLCCID